MARMNAFMLDMEADVALSDTVAPARVCQSLGLAG
jgi:hypothetical protein